MQQQSDDLSLMEDHAMAGSAAGSPSSHRSRSEERMGSRLRDRETEIENLGSSANYRGWLSF